MLPWFSAKLLRKKKAAISLLQLVPALKKAKAHLTTLPLADCMAEQRVSLRPLAKSAMVLTGDCAELTFETVHLDRTSPQRLL
jgi:hypothetical protein